MRRRLAAHLPDLRSLGRMTAAAILVGLAAPAPADLPPRESLGHTNKLRVLVDKVLMAANDWHMTEDNVRDIAAAGFNVVCPRIGGEDMARVRRVAELAQRHGVYYMAWMRGSLAAETGTKLVWANGSVQDLYSPNADELWQWMTEKIVGQARVSVEVPSVVGVFLDFENYAKGKQGNCYDLSYDDKIMREFAQATGIELPHLAPAERSAWLKGRGLHDQFAEFQIASWRARCRRLREQVHAINPRFQFIVYPAPGTLFIREAVWREWTTPRAPLILADACTYGRGGAALSPEQDALKANRRRLRDNMESVRKAGVPFLYTGGIDPIVWGADPEFSGKNAVMISEISDGYWIFYEGPTYGKEDHAAYWRWFTWANQAIAAADWRKQFAARETPDAYGADVSPGFDFERALAVVRRRPPLDRYEERRVLMVQEAYPRSRQFLAEHDAVALPLKWRFRADPGLTGMSQGWYRPDFDDSSWEAVSIERPWHEQGREGLTGSGWGRVKFEAPESFRGRKVMLYFGAVDEGGTIFVNGRYVHHHPERETADSWMMPFEVDVTDVVRPGEINTLAVLARAESTLGGVWKPVMLCSPKG